MKHLLVIIVIFLILTTGSLIVAPKVLAACPNGLPCDLQYNECKPASPGSYTCVRKSENTCPDGRSCDLTSNRCVADQWSPGIYKCVAINQNACPNGLPCDLTSNHCVADQWAAGVYKCVANSTSGDSNTSSVDGRAGEAIGSIIGKINPPSQVGNIGYGARGISTLLSNVVAIIFVLAGIATIFMVLISALQFIFSGGDKEAVANARKRLTYAIIGLVILAAAFWIVNIVGHIAGFNFYGDFQNAS